MLVTSWLAAFAFTVAIEVPLVVLATRGTPWPAWRRAVIAAFAQLATHPLVWFVFPYIQSLAGRESLWLSEVFAWIAEAGLYAIAIPGVRPLRALGVSALANGISLGIGLVLQAWRVL
jgi:hypothetical protein